VRGAGAVTDAPSGLQPDGAAACVNEMTSQQVCSSSLSCRVCMAHGMMDIVLPSVQSLAKPGMHVPSSSVIDPARHMIGSCLKSWIATEHGRLPPRCACAESVQDMNRCLRCSSHHNSTSTVSTRYIASSHLS